MPKMKTKRSAAKRFTILKSGKIKRNRAFGSHILTKKTRRRKTANKKTDYVCSANMDLVRQCLPNR